MTPPGAASQRDALALAPALRERAGELRGHRAAEVHLVGERHVQAAAQLGDAAAHAHELVEGKQLLLVVEVVALAVPHEVHALGRVQRAQHEPVGLERVAQLHEVVDLVDVGAHRHEDQVDEGQPSASALRLDEAPDVLEQPRERVVAEPRVGLGGGGVERDVEVRVAAEQLADVGVGEDLAVGGELQDLGPPAELVEQARRRPSS